MTQLDFGVGEDIPVEDHMKGLKKFSVLPTNSLITAFNSVMYLFRTSPMHFPTCMSIYPYISAFSFIVISHSMWGFPGGSEVKASAWNAGDPGLIPGSEDPLEKEMETHSSILALRIPWRKEPGRLQSMGSQRVGHD